MVNERSTPDTPESGLAAAPGLWLPWRLAGLCLLLAAVLAPPAPASESSDPDLARRHGDQANELFARSHRFVEGWLAHRDPASGLIPQNLRSPQWTPENSAADNYPFMVLTAYFTDEDLLHGPLTDILHDEIRLTTRVGALPDAFSFDTQTFVRPELNWDALIFGSAEYCKDGLLPMTEVMGRTEWFSRLRGMAAGICENARTESDFGPLPSNNAEVNGELMQVYARLYPATGDRRFLEMALRLGDAYLVEVVPHNGYLPCHFWDFTAHKPVNPRLGLNDHGNEILGGLTEVYVLASRYAPDKAEQYAPVMRRTMDTLLEKCRRDDGLWYGSYDTATGRPEGGPPDTWGYIFNGVYTCYLLTGDERYREATEQAMRAISSHTEWGGADAYADSIESGIVLLNRINVPETWQWVDRMTAAMSAIQKADGIIEGWHGDGNVARTWLMVALAKTGGCYVQPWRPDLRLGAVMEDDKLLVSLRAEREWSGHLYLDHPRHRDHFGVEPNYPRLNEWPEWFTVDDGSRYSVRVLGGRNVPPAEAAIYDGGTLQRGLPLALPSGGEWLAQIALVSTPPHGLPQVKLDAPDFLGGTGDVQAALTVTNLSSEPCEVTLSSDWGTIDPPRLALPPNATAAATLRGRVEQEGEAHVTARLAQGEGAATHRVLLVTDPNLTDYRDLSGSNTYQDETYWWLNDGDLVLRLRVQPGKAHVLSLYCGCKSDTRSARLTLAGETQVLTQTGYNGFRWFDLDLPADKLTGPELEIKLTKPESGPVSFLGRLKVRVK